MIFEYQILPYSKLFRFQIMSGTSLYEDYEWKEIRNAITENYYSIEKRAQVNDYFYLQKQVQLLEEIKEKLNKPKRRESVGSMEILPIDSHILNISNSFTFQNDESMLKSKFTEQFESSLVNSALKDVKKNCSDETYQTVKSHLMNSKQKQFETVSKNLEKKNKQNQELILNMCLKQSELNQAKNEITALNAKFQNLQEEKKKIKKKMQSLSQKQKRIHKAEVALLFKQKLYQQSKKRGERLKDFQNLAQSKLKVIENELQNIWKSILQAMNTDSNKNLCTGNCWRKDIMKKCKDKLLEERSILKEEEKNLEKEYTLMETVSDQFRTLIKAEQEVLFDKTI